METVGQLINTAIKEGYSYRAYRELVLCLVEMEKSTGAE